MNAVLKELRAGTNSNGIGGLAAEHDFDRSALPKERKVTGAEE